jgi:NTE family protein
VQIVPTEGEDHPTTSPHIVKRLNQITFNSALLQEIESIAAMKRLAGADSEDSAFGRKLAQLQLERIAAEEWFPDLSRHSALDLERHFVIALHERGREAAANWLSEPRANA